MQMHPLHPTLPGSVCAAMCRTALDGHLWGPALVLGHAMGEASFREAAAAMAAATLAPASPLTTLCLLHSGCHDHILGPLPGDTACLLSALFEATPCSG